MPGPKIVWGIDVGQFALRGLKLRLQGDAAEVLALDVIEYPQILSQPEVNGDQLLAEAVEKFVSRNDLRGADVVLGVPGQQTFTRFTKLPPVEPKKIGSIVTYEAQQQIPFDMDEVIWDYQTFQSPDSPEVEVGIFAIRRDLVRKYLSVFTDRKIEPVLVQASPLALYNYLAFDDMPQDGAVVILDVGAQNTDLVVARKEGAWTRNIPLGGNNFTEALVKSFKLSFGKAEALKRSAASSRYARQIFQAMRPVFADLVAEIQRSLGFYNSTHREVQVGKIIGMGNAFKLPGLQKYLQQNLQTEVDRLDSFKKLQPGPGVNAATFAEGVMSLGVAYGLAVQGLGIGRINNTLLPGETARSIVWRRKTPWFAATAATIAVAAGAMWYSQTRYASTLAALDPAGFNPTVASVEVADQVVRDMAANRLAGATTGKAKAQKVQAAAQRLKQDLQTVISEGSQPAEISQIVELYKDRALWIELMDKIHATLPRLWDDQSAPKTSEEYVEALTKTPRQLRQVVYIDAIEAGYVPDTNAAFASGTITRSSEMRGGGRGEDPTRGGMSDPSLAGGSEPGEKGFMLILRCRTPYGGTNLQAGPNQGEAAVFVAEWVKRLKALKGDSVQFHVVKIDERPQPWPMSVQQAAAALATAWTPPIDSLSARTNRTTLAVGAAFAPAANYSYDRGGGRGEDPTRGGGRGEDPTRGGGRGEDPSRGGGMGGYGAPAYGGGYGPSGGAVVSTRIDPLTGEPTSGDFAFLVKMTVVRGAAPEAPPADATTAEVR